MSQTSKIEELRISLGAILFYEIDPNLNPKTVEAPTNDRVDNNYGVNEDYTLQPLYMC